MIVVNKVSRDDVARLVLRQNRVLLFPPSTAKRRKRGQALSRRIGQHGSVFQHYKPWRSTAPAYGRYYVDIPGCTERQRQTVALGICTTRSVARQKLCQHIEREGINRSGSFAANTAPIVSFRTQAEKWITSLPTRRRKPIKPATIDNWRHALDKWILPTLGDKLLADVSNGAMRELIEKMAIAGLAPKTIVNHAQVVKSVLASAVNKEGDQLFPRTWNHDFIQLPIVHKESQRRPTLTASELDHILTSVKPRYAMLYALLAGTGVRIGEALGLKASDLSPDGTVLHVRRSIYRNKEQLPKTRNAVREVDIPQPLAELLRVYAASKPGYLFHTASGKPMGQRNALRALHLAGMKVGFHAFRRFRTETLRRARVPEDLTTLWLGHAKKTETDYYASGLSNDLEWRRQWCETAGLGFGLHGLQEISQIESRKAA